MPNRVWQRANFFLKENVVVPNTSDTVTDIVFTLAETERLGESVTGDPALGFTLSNAVKALEIGGVVWDSGFYCLDGVIDAEAPPVSLELWCREFMYSDSLNQDGNDRLGTAPAWNMNQTPVGSAGAQTAATTDVAYPKKIHYQQTRMANQAVIVVDNIGEGLGAVLDNGLVRQREPTRSKRLRLRYSDYDALFYSFAFVSGTSYANPLGNSTYKVWCAGSVYYRFRF